MSSSTVLWREAPNIQTRRTTAKIGDRAYVPLSIMEGKTGQAARALRNMPGAVIVECLGGHTKSLVILQAPD